MGRRPKIPRVPTEVDDVRNTIKRQLIELHFDELGAELVWTRVRYERLAALLGLTVYELGAAVRAKIPEVEKWLLRGSFPPAVELHLTFFERAAMRSPPKPPLFPIT